MVKSLTRGAILAFCHGSCIYVPPVRTVLTYFFKDFLHGIDVIAVGFRFAVEVALLEVVYDDTGLAVVVNRCELACCLLCIFRVFSTFQLSFPVRVGVIACVCVLKGL